MAAYAEFLVMQELQESTVQKYVNDIRHMIDYELSGKVITKEYLKQHYRMTSVNSYLRSVICYLQWADEKGMMLKTERIQEGDVFCRRAGEKPLNASGIWRMLKRLSRKAEVDPVKVYPHSFRHLFAKTYMRKIGNLAVLADLLGHANISTTFDGDFRQTRKTAF